MKIKFFLFMIFALMLLVIPSVLAADSTGKVCIFFFYSPDCSHCKATEPFISSLEEDYSSQIVINKYNVKELNSYTLYNKFCAIQNIPMEKRGIPLAIIGNQFFMGEDQIRNNLESSMQNAIAKNLTECPLPDVCSGNQTLNATSGNQPVLSMTKVTLPLITIAALADSINPCAIGVLIFLIGFLLLSSGGNKKRTLKISAIYILTVYVTYFLMGFGILAVLAKLSFLKSLNKILAVVVVLMGVINIKDAFKGGKAMLAIPAKAKSLIERWVHKVSIPAAIVLGVIVTLAGLPCTVGMYMAILTLLANSATKASGLWYLAYYNLIFVLPLIIIAFLFIFGFDAATLQNYLDMHKRKARMIIGIMLLVIGVLLFVL